MSGRRNILSQAGQLAPPCRTPAPAPRAQRLGPGPQAHRGWGREIRTVDGDGVTLTLPAGLFEQVTVITGRGRLGPDHDRDHADQRLVPSRALPANHPKVRCLRS